MSGIYKEYLTEDEAADYMCLSKSAFNQHKGEWKILPHRLPGVAKNVYKKSDLQAAMESILTPWLPNTKGDETGISSGQTQKANIVLASINSELQRKQRRKTSGSQKNSNSGPAQQ